MTAAAALDKQIERDRQMTGEQRPALARELREMSCDIAREGIRHQHPQCRCRRSRALASPPPFVGTETHQRTGTTFERREKAQEHLIILARAGAHFMDYREWIGSDVNPVG